MCQSRMGKFRLQTPCLCHSPQIFPTRWVSAAYTAEEDQRDPGGWFIPRAALSLRGQRDVGAKVSQDRQCGCARDDSRCHTLTQVDRR